MRYDSLKQLYEAIEKRLLNCKIVLNNDNLIIENSFDHYIKVVFKQDFYNVYIDGVFYHDVDKFDIEETVETIMTSYILFKNNTAHVLSQKEYEKVIKKDADAIVFRFNSI